jgi:hypothetical protein
MFTRHAWMLLGLLAAAGCTVKPGSPSDQLCAIGAGSVSGSPSVEIGTGAHQFFPRSNGEHWLGGFGPQGGAHCWLALNSHGLGPRVDVTYKMTELDGTVIYQGDPVQVCLTAASGGGQTTSGILGFITYTFPEPCSRILCGGPFKLSLTVTDSSGASASDERTVSGVDIGETPDSTTPPDCAGVTYHPAPACDGGLR